MVKTFGQAVPLEKPPEKAGMAPASAPLGPPKIPPSRFPLVALATGSVLSLFWIGVCFAYAWGFFGPRGLLQLTLPAKAALGAAIAMPPIFFLAIAAALARSAVMSDAARQMLLASEHL